MFVELDGATNEPQAASDAEISAELAVYILPNAPFVADFGALIFEIVPLSGGTVLDQGQLFLTPGLGTTFASTTLAFDDASQLQASAIPVPAAVWLFGSALGLLGWMRRRQAH